MKLSTKGEYAVKSCIYLAQNEGLGPVQTRQISQTQKISKPYIEQLFMKLRKDGLIKSVRGPSGGYTLAKDPKKITIGDIIRSVEGPIFTTLCSGGKDSSCGQISCCNSVKLWKTMGAKIEKALDSVTLGDL